MPSVSSKIGYVLWGLSTLPVKAQVGVQYQEYSQIFDISDAGNLYGMPFPILVGGRGKFKTTQSVTSFHDKDDTTICGETNPYGSDKFCAGHGVVYPGLVALVRALNRYSSMTSDDGTKFIQVSARPWWLGKVKASGTFPGTQVTPIFNPVMEEGGNWSVYGGITGDWNYVGIHKADDMERRKRDIIAAKAGTDLYIFNGDDGQGDAKAGEDSRDRKILNATLIHLVGGKPFATGDTRQGGSSNDIVFYLNYAHLASLLVDMGLISENRAKEVYNSIIQSAFGKSCCNDKKCSEFSADNDVDGTCGDGGVPKTLDTVFNYENTVCHPVHHAVFNLEKTGTTKDEIYGMCPSAKKTEVCACSDLVDAEGFGNCAKADKDGKKWCYVKNPLSNTCCDAKFGTSKGFQSQMWSIDACSPPEKKPETCEPAAIRGIALPTEDDSSAFGMGLSTLAGALVILQL